LWKDRQGELPSRYLSPFFGPPIFSAYSAVKKLKKLMHGGGYFERQRAPVAEQVMKMRSVTRV
jgi:hypothetical protein